MWSFKGDEHCVYKEKECLCRVNTLNIANVYFSDKKLVSQREKHWKLSAKNIKQTRLYPSLKKQKFYSQTKRYAQVLIICPCMAHYYNFFINLHLVEGNSIKDSRRLEKALCLSCALHFKHLKVISRINAERRIWVILCIAEVLW